MAQSVRRAAGKIELDGDGPALHESSKPAELIEQTLERGS
jgi:hypothetical protein